MLRSDCARVAIVALRARSLNGLACCSYRRRVLRYFNLLFKRGKQGLMVTDALCDVN